MKKRSSRENKARHVTPADRSVFYDLGFDEAEARVLEMRVDLMATLRELIEKRGWTQSEAAKQLGTTQPRISALMKGAWRDFSADMLLMLATRMGLRPTLKTGSVGGLCAMVAAQPAIISDGHFPRELSREYERQLLTLCASRKLDPAAWAAAGPAFFMSGLAVMLASNGDADRRGLLALAEVLHPGATEVAVFARWLKRSPLRPSRFLSMLAAETKHAAQRRHAAGISRRLHRTRPANRRAAPRITEK